MSDVVVTVPQALWTAWLAEGDLPDEPAEYESHFWIGNLLPDIRPGDRVYIVAWGRLRGYAPLLRVEPFCQLRPSTACLVRSAGAVACTIPQGVVGFRGWRYRFWEREAETPFPAWQTAGVGVLSRQAVLL
jgi:hypothetical protein